MRELFNFFSAIPVPIVIIFATVLTFFVILYIVKIKVPSWKMKLEDIQDFKMKIPKEMNEVRAHLVQEAHYKMSSILKECYDKGYKDTDDISAFGALMSDYLKFGGNHDSEFLRKEFEKLPFGTEEKVKKPLGSELPDEEDLKTMLQFYRDRLHNVTTKEDMQDVKEIFELKNKNKIEVKKENEK